MDATGTIGEFCEHGIETSDSITGEKLLDWQNDYQIIKKKSTTQK
jgi:hypothetical protein